MNMIQNLVYEDNGRWWVDVANLKDNPKNVVIYEDETAENKKQQDIADSMRKRIEKGLGPNIQSIGVWEDGMIDFGHTRVKAAIQAGIERLEAKYTDAPYPSDETPFDNTVHLLESNLMREQTHWVKLTTYEQLINDYEKQHGFAMPVPIRNYYIKQLSTSKKTLDMLADIKHHKPGLMKSVPSTMSVEYAWKDAMGKLKKVSPKKQGGMNLFNLFPNGSKRKIVHKSISYANQLRNVKMSFKFGEVNPFERGDISWEGGAFTTILSHTFMSAIAGILKEMGYEVRTANGHPTDPDIYLVNEDEKLEVKVVQFNGNGHATTWKGGMNVREGEYVLVAHDADFENIFVMMSTLTAEDWKPRGNVGSYMPLNHWWKNHKDKGDYEFWKGSIKLIKTNSNPDGIVTMFMEGVDE